jgi:nitrite reductase/ring-hydroxylating ferredoxin subunit
MTETELVQALCDSAEVPEGGVLAVERPGLPTLLVCNVDGTFHVVDDLCSHGASSLAEGRLIGCEIECALHKGRFDVTTGRATRRPSKKPITSYECVVRDGHVFLVNSSEGETA